MKVVRTSYYRQVSLLCVFFFFGYYADTQTSAKFTLDSLLVHLKKIYSYDGKGWDKMK